MADGVEMTPQLDLRERLDLYQGLRPIYLFHPEIRRCAADGLATLISCWSGKARGLFSSRRAPAIWRRIMPPTRCWSRGPAPSA